VSFSTNEKGLREGDYSLLEDFPLKTNLEGSILEASVFPSFFVPF